MWVWEKAKLIFEYVHGRQAKVTSPCPPPRALKLTQIAAYLFYSTIKLARRRACASHYYIVYCLSAEMLRIEV